MKLLVCKTIETLALLAIWQDSIVRGCPTILLSTNQRIDQGQTLYDGGQISLVQQFGGALQLFRGVPGNLECLMWENGISEVPVDTDFFYFTRLQGDGNLVTSKRDINGILPTQFPWGAGVIVEGFAEYYFILTCDGVVGIYDDDIPGAPLWSEQGNLCRLSTEAPGGAPSTLSVTVLQRHANASS